MLARLFTSVLFCVLFTGGAFAAPGSTPAAENPAAENPVPVISGAGGQLHSSGTADGLAARETAGPDTFVLYGGPDHPTEGKFQLANGVTADWGGGNGLPGGYGGGPDAWTPVDLTYDPVHWNVSTFNAENLNDNGPGNHAMWCGLPAGVPETAGWYSPPGYGNSWSEGIVYESDPVVDQTVGQIVDLEFFFNQEAEPGYDFFEVQYDSAGTWMTVFYFDQYTWNEAGEVAPPGARFSDNQLRPIEFTGNDYGTSQILGGSEDRIRIRLLFTSDGAWSDQDGLWPTDFGAVQVDDITLTHLGGTFAEGFEGAGPYLFDKEQTPFAGDFADVYPNFFDIDPCRDNNTPVAGFIDYGQTVRNGPGATGETSTGGTTWAGIEYGIAGNYVVNWTGGLTFGSHHLYNEIWSPPITWDVAGSQDDDLSVSGAFIRFDLWNDDVLTDAMFFNWRVRSALAGEGWGPWEDRGLAYHLSSVASWRMDRYDVSDLIEAGPERIQVALAARDLGGVFFPGATGSTPSPVFDNVAVYKYRLPGPTITTQASNIAQDGFPVNPSIDVSTPAARAALDVPFSMARDVNTGDLMNVAGDSITADVVSTIPGASVTSIEMVWALGTNPLFEDALRTAPARGVDQNVVAGPAGTIWDGEVVASQSYTSWGAVIQDRWFFDLPDVDFMYPGDALHYYIRAVDSDGRTSTLPHDISGFVDFGPSTAYDRAFTVRCLPTITDSAGAQPEILVWNDFGRGGGESVWLGAFGQLGYEEGVGYDTYTTQDPSSGLGNGLGSTGVHGASANQLAGYNHMFYFAGDLSRWLLSNGSDSGFNDKGDDIGVLEDWHALSGVRNCAYFGDNLGTAMVNASPESSAYLGALMGVAYGDKDVRDVIGGQTAPVVVSNAAGSYAGSFSTDFVAYGGCLANREFDQIQPAAGAAAGHLFTDAGGLPIPENPDPMSGGVASVINVTANGFDMTFPHSFSAIYDLQGRTVNLAARNLLLQEILGLFSAAPGGVPVAVPPGRLIDLSVDPNPFNPFTTVKFTGVVGMKGSVMVYNLRGELVRVLHSGEFTTEEFRWDGNDKNGSSVASGVYVVRAENEGSAQTAKVALVK